MSQIFTFRLHQRATDRRSPSVQVKVATLSFRLYESQDFGCLLARRFSVSLRPPGERLLRNSDGFGHFGGMLYDDIPVIPESGELFFGRLHGQR
jgi:hypothetical protein